MKIRRKLKRKRKWERKTISVQPTNVSLCLFLTMNWWCICYFKFSKNRLICMWKEVYEKTHSLCLSRLEAVRGMCVCVWTCIGQMLTVFDLIINVLINNLHQNAGRFVYSVTIVNQIHPCGVCVCVSSFNCRRPIQINEGIAIGVWWCFISLYSSLFCRSFYVRSCCVFFLSILSLFFLFIILVYVDCSVGMRLDRIKALVSANISFSLFSSSPAHWHTHGHGESCAFDTFVRENSEKLVMTIAIQTMHVYLSEFYFFFPNANSRRCLYGIAANVWNLLNPRSFCLRTRRLCRSQK